MEQIPEKIVEEVWRETAQFGEARIKKEIEKLGREQGELLAFALEFSQDMDESAAEMTIYLFFNVYRAFQKGYGKKIGPISADRIIEHYEANESMLEHLEGAHDRFLDRAAENQAATQPHLMRYLLEALFEGEEDEDPPDISEDDSGLLFIVLKTVIDVLNSATD